MKRVFIAIKIELDPDLQQFIRRLKQQLKEEHIRWVPNDKQHLTLRFLGDLSEEQINLVQAAMKRVVADLQVFSFQLNGLGHFNHRGQPAVIYLAAPKNEMLYELVRQFRAELQEIGIDSSKKFTPHLTVGRLKHLRNRLQFERIMEKFGETMAQEVFVREFVLYESRLFPSGPEYHVLAKYTLR
ncbi:RNA 2',3'-cyclic phosphodiesterase [Sunxiuqinia sp. sy24]|uniref:RNA 2',3'-cyclic phosphodiesterase n=1 Tax=Sunxiuqinia sp. sy24 TaxID=3461495 RepID=UPI004045652E